MSLVVVLLNAVVAIILEGFQLSESAKRRIQREIFLRKIIDGNMPKDKQSGSPLSIEQVVDDSNFSVAHATSGPSVIGPHDRISSMKMLDLKILRSLALSRRIASEDNDYSNRRLADDLVHRLELDLITG